MAGIVLSAYIDAYAHVKVPGRVIHNIAGVDPATAALAAVTVCWFLLTGFLFFAFGRGLRHGRPWNRALPDGYTGSLAAALVFGAALIADNLWPDAAGSIVGLFVLIAAIIAMIAACLAVFLLPALFFFFAFYSP